MDLPANQVFHDEVCVEYYSPFPNASGAEKVLAQVKLASSAAEDKLGIPITNDQPGI